MLLSCRKALKNRGVVYRRFFKRAVFNPVNDNQFKAYTVSHNQSSLSALKNYLTKRSERKPCTSEALDSIID